MDASDPLSSLPEAFSQESQAETKEAPIMVHDRERNLALFIDFDNVALGAREAGLRFDIQILLQRLLEKGKIIVKKAYADWSHYKDSMANLHAAGIELIEIPRPRMSGKNSADIRLVVDAMDICHGKSHLDSFVIVSGDSDFSPLVAKLRENNKSVIGLGVKQSTSQLLVNNCDEFIFYDDLMKESTGRGADSLAELPEEQKKLFDFLLATARGLFREGREHLFSSLIKDTMKRKRPAFDECNFGYATFGEFLEEAASLDLLEVTRDSSAGGTWVVTGLGREARSRSRRPRRTTRPRSKSSESSSKSEGAKSSTSRTRRPARSSEESKADDGKPAATTRKRPTKRKTVTRKTTTRRTNASAASQPTDGSSATPSVARTRTSHRSSVTRKAASAPPDRKVGEK